MEYFEIQGGKRLSGTIVPQGAKNEALQILSATLLTPEIVTISNIPDIRDVNMIIQLIGRLGSKVEKLASDTYSFQADNLDLEYLQSDEYLREAQKLRGSIMLIGPLL